MWTFAGNGTGSRFKGIGWRVAILLAMWGTVATADEVDRYAFLIGVGDYDSPDFDDLKNTVPEIEDLHKILKQQRAPEGDSFYERIFVITDNTPKRTEQIDGNVEYIQLAPRRANIFAGLDKLRAALLENNQLGAKQRSVLVVLNGHGVELQNEQFEFTYIPTDGTKGDRRSRITIEEIEDALRFPKEDDPDRRVIPTEILFIVNACRNDEQAQAAGDGAKNVEVKLDSPRSAILYACDQRQKSWIDSTASRSYFMSALLAAWEGAADGAAFGQMDNSVNLEELALYLKKTVSEQVKISKNLNQQPYLASRSNLGNWLINPSIPEVTIGEAKIVRRRLPTFLRNQRDWSGYTFIGVDFSGHKFNATNLSNVQFKGCKLRNAMMLGRANLYRASFFDCDLEGLDFSGAKDTTEYLLPAGANANADSVEWGNNPPPDFDLATGR